jgi:hypothetical protein
MISNYSKDYTDNAGAEDFDSDEALNRFNSQRLSPNEITQNNFVDISDGYANEGMIITFDPIHVDGMVSFKAFISSYTETFSSDYNSEQVFGRIDPIHTFKQTTRNGTLSFVIPSSTASEAYESLYKVDKLRSMLYPTYTNTGNAITINQNPLIRIGVMNLLTNGKVSNNYKKLFGAGGVPDFEMEGALAAVSSMNINFNLEGDAGVFEAGGTPGAPQKGVLPKLIEIAIDFSVIHEENMGRETDGSANDTKMAYGTNPADMASDIASDLSIREAAYKATIEDQERAEEAGIPTASQATKDGRIASFFNAMGDRRSLRRMTDTQTARELQRSGISAEGLDAAQRFSDDEFEDLDVFLAFGADKPLR